MRRSGTAALLIGWLLCNAADQCLAQLGTTVCICSPATYEISFDFSRNCDNSALQGDGIVTSDCAVAPFQDDSVTDLVPVAVGSIDILELDENLVLLTQSSRFGTYGNEDSFPYESISRNPSDVNATSYPRALQVSVIGNNAAGETLFFAGLIVFVTDCSAYPTLMEGSSIGWIRFSKLETPNKQICPMSAPMGPAFENPIGFGSHSTSSSGSGSTKNQRPSPPATLRPLTHSPTRPPVMSPVVSSTEEDCYRSTEIGKGKGKKKKSKSDKNIRKKGKKGKYYYYDYHSECHGSHGSDHAVGKHKKSKKGKGSAKKSKHHKGAFDYDQILDMLHHHPPDAAPVVSTPVRPPSLSPTQGSVGLEHDNPSQGLEHDDPSQGLEHDDHSTDASRDDSASADHLSSADQRAELPDRKPFWGSPGYYILLFSIVGASLAGAALMFYQPHRRDKMTWAERIQFRTTTTTTRDQMSLMKGMDQWSNTGLVWAEAVDDKQ